MSIMFYISFCVSIFCCGIFISDKIKSARGRVQNLELELSRKKEEIDALKAKYANLKDEFYGLEMFADHMRQDNLVLQTVLDTLETCNIQERGKHGHFGKRVYISKIIKQTKEDLEVI